MGGFNFFENKTKLLLANMFVFAAKIDTAFMRKERLVVTALKLFKKVFKQFSLIQSFQNPLKEDTSYKIALNLTKKPALSFFINKNEDTSVLKYMKKFLKQADCFVDVGAEMGSFSLPVAHAFPKLSIHAFEPLPYNFKILNKNMDLNGITNTQTHNMAISSKQGKTKLYLGTLSNGHNSLIHSEKNNGKSIDVQTQRLDSIITNKKVVMKIDVEGAEYEVIQSAQKLFENNSVLAIYIEVIKGKTDAKIHDYLTSFGFKTMKQFTPEKDVYNVIYAKA